MTPTTISNDDQLIDSRDVIERIEHLAQLEQPGPVDLGSEDNEQDQDTLLAELRALRGLAEQGEQYAADWQYGATLVHNDYFEDYARELAYDLGLASKDAQWPHNRIDWESAAEDLKVDYTAVDFAGVTYWVR